MTQNYTIRYSAVLVLPLSWGLNEVMQNILYFLIDEGTGLNGMAPTRSGCEHICLSYFSGSKLGPSRLIRFQILYRKLGFFAGKTFREGA